jgi:DNA polymerase III subunit gamma/tau
VFATTEPEKVIPTIRSRTHHYPFRLMPPAVLRKLLEEILDSERVAYEPEVLPVVIRAGAGSARDALSILDQLLAGSDESGLTYQRAVTLLGHTDESLLDDVVAAFANGDGGAAFRAVDRVVEGGHDPRRFAADLLDRLRDLIVLAAVPNAADTGLLDVPADRLERMQEQASAFGQGELARAAGIVHAGLVEMRGATSPRLLLELMCAQVLLPAPTAGEAALLARLERLEHRLGPGGDSGQTEHSRPQRAAAAAPADARPAPSRPTASRPTAGRSTPPATAAQSADAQSADARPAADEVLSTDAEAGAASGTEAQEAAAGAPAPPDSAPARAGSGSANADAGSLRERWPDVLEAVRRERRVAWMLLSNASVESLTDGVLTLMFAKQGEAKGFANSGYDAELGRVLQQMFGISPRIRALSAATSSAAADGERRVPAQARQGDRGSGAEQQPAHAETPRPQPPAPTSETPGYPDDVPGQSADALSGMDLIERELGGRIIAESSDD